MSGVSGVSGTSETGDPGDPGRARSAAPHRRLPPLLSARVRRALVGLVVVVVIAALYLFVLTRGAVL